MVNVSDSRYDLFTEPCVGSKNRWEVAVTGLENAEEADFAAEMAGIPRHFEQTGGRTMAKHDRVHAFLEARPPGRKVAGVPDSARPPPYHQGPTLGIRQCEIVLPIIGNS